MTFCTWNESVPPAVAGGYAVFLVVDALRTHPLPRVVLTRQAQSPQPHGCFNLGDVAFF